MDRVERTIALQDAAEALAGDAPQNLTQAQLQAARFDFAASVRAVQGLAALMAANLEGRGSYDELVGLMAALSPAYQQAAERSVRFCALASSDGSA